MMLETTYWCYQNLDCSPQFDYWITISRQTGTLTALLEMQFNQKRTVFVSLGKEYLHFLRWLLISCYFTTIVHTYRLTSIPTYWSLGLGVHDSEHGINMFSSHVQVSELNNFSPQLLKKLRMLRSCLCPDAIFDVLGVHVFSDKHKNSKIHSTLVLISREYWMETFCLISRKVYLEGKSKSSKKVQFLEWMLKDSLESLFSVNAESSSRWRGMPGVTQRSHVSACVTHYNITCHNVTENNEFSDF